MISRSVLDSVRCGVCAIGYSRVPLDDYVGDPRGPHFVIVGTGFLVREDVVLTNRHVLNRLDALIESEALGEERRFLRFDVASAGGRQAFVSGLGRVGLLNSKTRDLAVVKFTPDDTGLFKNCKPPRFQARLQLQVGKPIASVGYVAGVNALERMMDAGVRQAYRIGPILQQGYVSALAPHDDNPFIDRILLDLRSSEGLSGAPVFDPQAEPCWVFTRHPLKQ
jgi:S1-C subfamily serine protease